MSQVSWFAIGCAVLVAICWGMYGPAVANSRSTSRPPDWGPFKPYVFIGIAYFALAAVGGALMMGVVSGDNFNYTGKYYPAMKWGFVAGCLGALGALALTFSLTSAGGKPAYVMPIVFGGAVSVNAICAYLKLHKGEVVNPMLWIGMLLVVVGICLTAGYTPHGHVPSKPAGTHTVDNPPA
jgi:drug/metabolite transporter (DMT)-like permease